MTGGGVDYAQVAGTTGAVIGALSIVLSALWKFVLLPRSLLRKSNDQKYMKEQIAEAVAPITGQLKNNGGSSFKDSVDRQFKEIAAHLRTQDVRMAATDARIDAVLLSLIPVAKRTQDDEGATSG